MTLPSVRKSLESVRPMSWHVQLSFHVTPVACVIADEVNSMMFSAGVAPPLVARLSSASDNVQFLAAVALCLLAQHGKRARPRRCPIAPVHDCGSPSAAARRVRVA